MRNYNVFCIWVRESFREFHEDKELKRGQGMLRNFSVNYLFGESSSFEDFKKIFGLFLVSVWKLNCVFLNTKAFFYETEL